MTPEDIKEIKDRWPIASKTSTSDISRLISEVERVWAEIERLNGEMDKKERLDKEISEFDAYFEGT